MSFRVEWLLKPRIAFIQVSQTIDLVEVIQANRAITDFLDQAEAPLYVVVDVSTLTGYPHIATELRALVSSFYHPNLGGTYLYGITTPAISVILRILARISPFPYRIVDSLDEALAGIVAREPALASLVAKVELEA